MSVYITGDLKIPEANFRLVQLWNDGTACWKQDGKFMRGQWQYVSEHGDLIERAAADGKKLAYKKLIQLIVDDIGEDAVYKMVQECVEDWDAE